MGCITSSSRLVETPERWRKKQPATSKVASSSDGIKGEITPLVALSDNSRLKTYSNAIPEPGVFKTNGCAHPPADERAVFEKNGCAHPPADEASKAANLSASDPPHIKVVPHIKDDVGHESKAAVDSTEQSAQALRPLQDSFASETSRIKDDAGHESKAAEDSTEQRAPTLRPFQDSFARSKSEAPYAPSAPPVPRALEHRKSFSLIPLPAKFPSIAEANQPRRLKPIPLRPVPSDSQTEADTDILAAAIQDWSASTSLAPLDLSGLSLGLERPHTAAARGGGGWAALRQLAADCGRPLALNLARNGIRGDAEGLGGGERAWPMSVLLELVACSSLTDLDLRGNELSPDDARLIACAACARCADAAPRGRSASSAGASDASGGGSGGSGPSGEGAGARARGRGREAAGLRVCGIPVGACLDRGTTRLSLYNEALAPADAALLAEVTPPPAFSPSTETHRPGPAHHAWH
jgi:hypothetical protein